MPPGICGTDLRGRDRGDHADRRIGLYDERQKVDVALFKALETDGFSGLA